MDRQERAPATLALALGAVLAGMYSQVLATGLLLRGVLVTGAGSDLTTATLLLGAVHVAVAVVAYAAAHGLWTGRRWSWSAGLFVFGVLIVASCLRLFVATDIASAVIVTVLAAVAIWQLLQPATRARLVGAGATDVAGDRSDLAAGAPALGVPPAVR